MRLRSLLSITLFASATLLCHTNAQALGASDPSFNEGQIRFETFEDEYGIGFVPEHVSLVSIVRGASGSSYLAVYGVTDNEMPNRDRIGLARYTLDGQRLDTFDVDGIAGLALVGWPNGSSRFIVQGAALETGGKLLVLGRVVDLNDPMALENVLCRLNASGSMDSSYGTSGCRRLPDLSDDGGLTARMVVGNSGDAYVFAYHQPTGFRHVQHVDGNGDIDAGFGIGGVFTIQPPLSATSSFGGGKVLPDGRLLIVGSTSPPVDGMGNNNYDWFALRVLADGSEDQSFGSLNGYRLIKFDLGGQSDALNDFATGLQIDADGNLLISGHVQLGEVPSSYGVGVLRLSGDGLTIDPDYGTSNTDFIAYTQVSLYSGTSTSALLPDGALMVAGWHSILGDAGADPAMLVLDANGDLDSRFWQVGTHVVELDRTTNINNSGHDGLRALWVDAEQERVVVGGYAEGFVDNDYQGMVTSLALHDRLFKDGLEDL